MTRFINNSIIVFYTLTHCPYKCSNFIFLDFFSPYRLPALSLIGKEVLIEFSHFGGDPGKERGATEVYLISFLIGIRLLSLAFKSQSRFGVNINNEFIFSQMSHGNCKSADAICSINCDSISEFFIAILISNMTFRG